MYDDILGQQMTTNSGDVFVVICKNGRNKSHQQKYRVRFIETGYEVDVLKCEIKSRSVKDYFKKTVYGVGFYGAYTPGLKQEKLLWTNMMSRCYNKKNKDYADYGAKGVTVCKKWHCFIDFFKDIKKIDGYDEQLFKEHRIVLDKDKKQKNKAYCDMIYSVETCTFLTNSENSKERNTDNYKVKFYAVDKNGNEVFVSGIVRFCKENNLDSKLIKKRLDGKTKSSYNGWTFHY